MILPGQPRLLHGESPGCGESFGMLFILMNCAVHVKVNKSLIFRVKKFYKIKFLKKKKNLHHTIEYIYIANVSCEKFISFAQLSTDLWPFEVFSILTVIYPLKLKLAIT